MSRPRPRISHIMRLRTSGDERCAAPGSSSLIAGSGGGADGDDDGVVDEHAPDRALDGCLVDGGPAPDLLVDRTDRAGGDELAAVPGHSGASVLEAELEGPGEVADGDVELVVGDPIADQSVELGTHQVDHFGTMLRLRT